MLIVLYLLTTCIVFTVLPWVYFATHTGERLIRMLVGPALEWWVTQLVNLTVFVHAADVAAMHKERITPPSESSINEIEMSIALDPGSPIDETQVVAEAFESQGTSNNTFKS